MLKEEVNNDNDETRPSQTLNSTGLTDCASRKASDCRVCPRARLPNRTLAVWNGQSSLAMRRRRLAVSSPPSTDRSPRQGSLASPHCFHSIESIVVSVVGQSPCKRLMFVLCSQKSTIPMSPKGVA